MPTGERADWAKKVDYRRQRFERSYTRAPGTPAPEEPEPEGTPGVTEGGCIIVISNAYARSSEDVIVVENPIVVTGSIITPWP